MQPMIMRAAVLGAAFALSACGEMVFKRGAGPGDMAGAQADCRANAQGESAYVACMEKAGYVILGSQDSVFVDGSASAAAGQPKGDRPSTLFVEGAVAPPSAPAVQPLPAPVPVAPTRVTAAPAAAPALDPLEQVDVVSWWKLGGSADALAAAQAGCIDRLGNAHRPAPDSTKFTRAMIGCLRDAGWRGIGR